AGEVGRRWQAGLAPDDVAPAVPVERAGDAVGAGVLPYDRVVQRPPGALVPDYRCLPLVRDAERGQVGRGQVGVLQPLLPHLLGALPDLDRVVFDPAGLGQDLLVLELRPGDLAAPVVEDHEPGAGRALVDGTDKLRHWSSSLRRWRRCRPAAGGRARSSPR